MDRRDISRTGVAEDVLDRLLEIPRTSVWLPTLSGPQHVSAGLLLDHLETKFPGTVAHSRGMVGDVFGPVKVLGHAESDTQSLLQVVADPDRPIPGATESLRVFSRGKCFDIPISSHSQEGEKIIFVARVQKSITARWDGSEVVVGRVVPNHQSLRDEVYLGVLTSAVAELALETRGRIAACVSNCENTTGALRSLLECSGKQRVEIEGLHAVATLHTETQRNLLQDSAEQARQIGQLSVQHGATVAGLNRLSVSCDQLAANVMSVSEALRVRCDDLEERFRQRSVQEDVASSEHDRTSVSEEADGSPLRQMAPRVFEGVSDPGQPFETNLEPAELKTTEEAWQRDSDERVQAVVLAQAKQEVISLELRDGLRAIEDSLARKDKVLNELTADVAKLRADLCSVAHYINTLPRHENDLKASPDSQEAAPANQDDIAGKLVGVWHGLPPETSLRIIFEPPLPERKSGRASVAVGSRVEFFDWEMTAEPICLRMSKEDGREAVLQVRLASGCRHVKDGAFEDVVLHIGGSIYPATGKQHQLARLSSIASRDAAALSQG